MGFPLGDFAKEFQANGRILAQDLSKDLTESKYSDVTSQEVPHTCKCFSAPFFLIAEERQPLWSLIGLDHVDLKLKGIESALICVHEYTLFLIFSGTFFTRQKRETQRQSTWEKLTNLWASLSAWVVVIVLSSCPRQIAQDCHFLLVSIISVSATIHKPGDTSVQCFILFVVLNKYSF